MAITQFIHTAVHTVYSLSEGAIHIDKLARHAAAEGMPAVAMTDTNNLFAALQFSVKMREAGVQPIIGCTLGIYNPHLAMPRHGRKPLPDQIRLYAQNEDGYRNLLKLVSKAHLETPADERPRILMEDLATTHENLLITSPGVAGPLGHLILDGAKDHAVELLKDIKGLFGDRFYIELHRHGMEEEEQTEETLLDLAFDHDVPIIASNDVYFLSEDMYEAHDALLCIAGGTYVSEADRRRLTKEHYFKSARAMANLFSDLPEAVENTLYLAERTSYAPLPINPLLPNFTEGRGVSEYDLLQTESRKGLEERLKVHVFEEGMAAGKQEELAKPYRDRLEYELKIIGDMGFPGYFLIVADFIQWAKDNEVPVGPGRGSGAGSVVAWSLKITDLDPLRFGLLFERFLNPERVSMPDFDIDFCQERRDRVIRYVQEKYGIDRVAQIITYGKLQARAALRDVGRVMQQPYPVTDRLCKMIPNNPANPTSLQEALDEEPRLRAERDSDELTAAVIDTALKLEGLYRHASTHAAGVVIGDRPLVELVPLYRDPRSDMPVTQFDMKWVEQAGLVKFDFLGLKTLTVIKQAVDIIKAEGTAVKIDEIPLDDPVTFKMLTRGDTAGVFQLESAGMRSALKAMRPDKFEDIIALVALYRPGPMDNIPSYNNRKHGMEEVDYLHPWLQEVLEETYGIIIYQEQVMQIAQILAGYSLGEADLLRRAMGKKIQAEMDKQRVRFIEGAVEKGVDGDKAEYIFELVNKFAGYGFNKSHAAAYALVAYQTAWLKANHPVAFMAATMTLDMQNTDKLAQHRKELKNLDIPLLPPDINTSEVIFQPEEITFPAEEGTEARTAMGIRYALAAIRNVGEKAMGAIVEERAENGPYKDILDFAERMDLKHINKRALENMIAAGVFDSLNGNRAELMGAVELILRHAHATAEARDSSQVSLFAEGDSLVDRPQIASKPPWTETESLAHEKDAIGFYLTSHPLEMFESALRRQRIATYADVISNPKYIDQEIRMAGAVEGFQVRRSAKSGKRFAYLALSDLTGGFETMVFGELVDHLAAIIEETSAVIVTVAVVKNEDDDDVRLFVRGAEPLAEVAARTPSDMEVFIEDSRSYGNLKSLLARYTQGKGQVFLTVLTAKGDEVRLSLPGHYKVTPELRGAVKATEGVMDAREI